MIINNTGIPSIAVSVKKLAYPIIDGIPRLSPEDVIDDFKKRKRAILLLEKKRNNASGLLDFRFFRWPGK